MRVSTEMRAIAAVLLACAAASSAFAPQPTLRPHAIRAAVARVQPPYAQDASAAIQRRRGLKRRKDEALFVKGIAGAALLRLAASSRMAAFAAAIAAPLIVVGPPPAVEALLLSALLTVVGAASYWPTNLVVMGLGAYGFIGCANGLLVWWESRTRVRARRKKKRVKRRTRSDDDGSGDLVALTIGALTAAILGALP